MGTEMTTLTAAEKVTIPIERENRSRMMILLCSCSREKRAGTIEFSRGSPAEGINTAVISDRDCV